MAAKKVEGLTENSRGDVAVIGYRVGKRIEIDIVEFHWASLANVGGEWSPMPWIPMEDGDEVIACEVDGYLGVELGPENERETKHLISEWIDKVKRHKLELPSREAEAEAEAEDEEEEEEEAEVEEEEPEEEEEDEPIRVRPRKR